MDFDLTDEQIAISELAATVLADASTPEALRSVEAAGGDRIDASLWRTLADTGLLGVTVPEENGGAGLGMVELCLLLKEVGRRTAPVPAFGALALGALPVSRRGTAAQRAAILPGVVDGSRIVTAALSEPLSDPTTPSVRARRDGDRWRLDGVRSNVPAGTVADVILMPATTDGQQGLFMVDPTAPGVRRTRQETTTGTPEALIELDGATVGDNDLLGGALDHGDALRDVVAHATVASCAVMAGVAAEAIRLTGEYTTARHQFGKPLASLQAVTQRAGDAYVDAQAIELTMIQAAWRLSAGLDAEREVAIAKYWAAAGGQRAVHAAQHLHGGTGVDRDYPLHRYFLWAKQLELYLGGATRQLLRLGQHLADHGASQ